MITKRDKEILIWIEKYRSITINHCVNVVYFMDEKLKIHDLKIFDGVAQFI